MIIAMTLSMSGGRYDDRQWPGPGVPFEVPDWEGEGLVRDHNAVKIADSARPARGHAAVPAPVPLPAETAAGPVTPEPPPGPGPEPVPPPEPEPEPEPPSQSDPKQAWIAWAVSQGEDEAAAAGMTKADLMSKHGGRL